MGTKNINVGLLGHVDSGKTSLAKALSQVESTACFDKNPQSQERGITIDLGFSSFITEANDVFKHLGYDKLQFTLVDCPGHASLIRTIIGGAQIIDLVILVIDITKGIQTQTAECLVLTEIIGKNMLIALNKSDLLPVNNRQSEVEKVKKKLKNTCFKSSPIIQISACVSNEDGSTKSEGITELIEALRDMTFYIERLEEKPMLLSVDHCFAIKGKGTVLTGTLIQGTIKMNDNLEIPALNLVKKVKSVQMFKKEVKKAFAGDRIGVCITQFDAKLLERGLVCSPGYIIPVFAVIIRLNKVKHFRDKIKTNSKYHITIGYETIIAKLTLFKDYNSSSETFSYEKDYPFIPEFADDESDKEGMTLALLEFEKSVLVPSQSLVIGSKLDIDIHTSSCRLVFYGNSLAEITDKNYVNNILPNIKIYKMKEKSGVVQKMINSSEVIASSLFKKETKMQTFTNFKVVLSTGELGIIEGAFGLSGKVKIRIPDGLHAETEKMLLPKQKGSQNNTDIIQNKRKPKVLLRFKKYIFDKDKKIIQN